MPFGYIRDAAYPSDEHVMDCGVVNADGTLHVGAVSIDRVIQFNLLTAAAIVRDRLKPRQSTAQGVVLPTEGPLSPSVRRLREMLK